jgi:hypothetical protein
MTSNGLALKYEEQMKKQKEKKEQEPEINENQTVDKTEDSEPKGFVLDDWD